MTLTRQVKKSLEKRNRDRAPNNNTAPPLQSNALEATTMRDYVAQRQPVKISKDNRNCRKYSHFVNLISYILHVYYRRL